MIPSFFIEIVSTEIGEIFSIAEIEVTSSGVEKINSVEFNGDVTLFVLVKLVISTTICLSCDETVVISVDDETKSNAIDVVKLSGAELVVKMAVV